jgi:hypothetical protein
MSILNETYMLTRENIINHMSNNLKNNKLETKLQANVQANIQANIQANVQAKISNNSNNKNYNKNKISDIFFWTIYKIVKDIDDSELYDKANCFVIEKEFKIKCIEDLRKIKSKLKIYKLSLSEVENQLLNEKTINLTAFFALALLFNLNIFYIWDYKYYEFNCCGDAKQYIIKNVNNVITIIDEPVLFYKENYYQVENFKKPIKSITNYNKDELILMAKKLNLNINNAKIIKSDIYQQIITKL